MSLIKLLYILYQVKEEMKKEKRRIQEQLRRIKRNQEREKQVASKQVCIQFILICDWSDYVSYLNQPIRAQIVFNPPITDIRINYLELYFAIKNA